MPAYMIFTREGPVVDQAAMDAYSQANRSNAGHFVERFGLKLLSVYGKLQALEGDAPDGVVLLEFPTTADARAWYDSPEYQAALADRQRGADYRAILIEAP